MDGAVFGLYFALGIILQGLLLIYGYRSLKKSERRIAIYGNDLYFLSKRVRFLERKVDVEKQEGIFMKYDFVIKSNL